MSSKYFATVYDIVKPIATFLHPIRVEGLENVPREGPVLLCPNHSSNWDPILLICALGREANLQIMGKNQLFKIPFCARSCGKWVYSPWTGATPTSAR